MDEEIDMLNIGELPDMDKKGRTTNGFYDFNYSLYVDDYVQRPR